ncbi:ADP-ribosylglycohydrolase [Nannizzia gypsea CBS 118893]|uniref:ADP-ribosylglycohydrolase n=1 Tax=Arthroderma gypseum (strain ATCC MYA-4604 / CBS 118893) TaxID=535722 RepID=E4UWH7_ARTGP|nr:ADP-ribosylglycohydrolase [Nannizzia gypsea CBS 118893]EFR01733.1 ADP-ribosylglycohydrolase [Nannizzia gypsea CBS 118893]
MASRTDPGIDFVSTHPFVKAAVQEKIRGAIFGSALGDCIGLYTEFLSKKIAKDAYPQGRFQLVDPATKFRNDGHRSKFSCPSDFKSWTDDTDHALLILLSYLHHNGQVPSTIDLAERLKIWVVQGLRALDRPPCGLGKTVGSIVLDKEYLNNPNQKAHQFWVKGDRNVAPNGSLMRTHPLGIICLAFDLEKTFQVATDFSLVTHADPRCVLACCISTGLIRGILRGEILDEKGLDTLMEDAYSWVDSWVRKTRLTADETNGQKEDEIYEPAAREFLDREEFDKHAYAKTFSDLLLDDSYKIGYVYKCLGAAILSLRMGMQQSPFGSNAGVESSFILTDSAVFEKIITELTYEAGDADTNACAAGALLGCWLGYNSLPSHWRDGMDNRDWLMQKCNSLIQVIGVGNENALPYDGKLDADTSPDGGKGLMSEKELGKRDSDMMFKYMSRHAEGVAEEKARLKADEKQKKGWKSFLG